MHSQAAQAEKRSNILKKKQQNKTKNKTMNNTMTPLHSPGKISVEYNGFCPRRDFAQRAKSRGGTLVTRAYIKESTYS